MITSGGFQTQEPPVSLAMLPVTAAPNDPTENAWSGPNDNSVKSGGCGLVKIRRGTGKSVRSIAPDTSVRVAVELPVINQTGSLKGHGDEAQTKPTRVKPRGSAPPGGRAASGRHRCRSRLRHAAAQALSVASASAVQMAAAALSTTMSRGGPGAPARISRIIWRRRPDPRSSAISDPQPASRIPPAASGVRAFRPGEHRSRGWGR